MTIADQMERSVACIATNTATNIMAEIYCPAPASEKPAAVTYNQYLTNQFLLEASLRILAARVNHQRAAISVRAKRFLLTYFIIRQPRSDAYILCAGWSTYNWGIFDFVRS